MKKRSWVIVALMAIVLLIIVCSVIGSNWWNGRKGVSEPVATSFVPVATSVIATIAPVKPASETPTAVPTVVAEKETAKADDWDITWFPAADFDRGDGKTFRYSTNTWVWRKIAPELWPTFPNVPNPLVPEFRVVNGNEVPDGLEYAMDESNFCQQLAGESCRVPVAAMHYLYFSGDYDVPGIGSCSENDRIGCMLVVVNPGRVTADLTGVFGQGFRLHARYWNGNKLDQAIWALVSHGSNSMMNFDSKLNPNGIQNAGANCSVPEACKGVNVRVFFLSGNEPLLMLESIVTR